jgi:hypothetical protein
LESQVLFSFWFATSLFSFRQGSKRKQLLQGQLDLLNYAIRHSYSYKRWHKVATFMIRKDPQASKIHRLRVIHMCEADLNLLLGVKWRSLTHHCMDNDLLHHGQFGGLPGRSVFLEELQWETARASRRSLLREWTLMPLVVSTRLSQVSPVSPPEHSANTTPSVLSMPLSSVKRSTSSRQN